MQEEEICFLKSHPSMTDQPKALTDVYFFMGKKPTKGQNFSSQSQFTQSKQGERAFCSGPAALTQYVVGEV